MMEGGPAWQRIISHARLGVMTSCGFAVAGPDGGPISWSDQHASLQNKSAIILLPAAAAFWTSYETRSGVSI